MLQNEITSFNLVSGNVLNAKTLDPYLRELLTEHYKHICISLDKQLTTLPQQKNLVYGPLSIICAAMKPDREASVGSEDEGKNFECF